ncbi:zealexin A1 synthase-like [Triticum dicoccoides]|uniref:zealexin A1 synthase-like n=1 Tax=Triticum dicoccoides TaxID=85692 RepID=UPI00188FD936|nr:zealexin A1 synthase-like [Triticum dicoccoides]
MEGWLSLCFIALCTLVALWFRKLSGGKRKPQLPPGPWTLPIIGSLHHVASVLPHRRMMEMSRRHGPLMHLMLGEVPTVIVSSAEAAALVMKTNDLAFAGRPHSATLDIFGCGGRGIVFAPYGDPWRQMRKVCTMELLSSKQVRRMDGIRPEQVGNLLRYVAAAASTGAAVNVSEKVMALSNDVVSRAVFGGKFPQQEEYLRELDEAFVLLGGFCLVDLFPSSWLVRWLSNGERHMRRSYGHIQRINADVIEGRKAARAAAQDGASSTDDDDDLLDVLLRLQEEDTFTFPMTTESIGAVLFDIFAGATQTTGVALEWAMAELIRHPQTMAKAQLEIREVLGQDRTVITNSDLAELHYMRMIIKEVLRLHPPGPLIPRRAREDRKVMGFDMLEGTNVYINAFAVSRDPNCWESPEEFKPERFENNNMDYNGTYFEFTPFGAGRRQCPGILFGTSTMEIALANLLYHFDWVLPRKANPQFLDMTEKYGIIVGRKYDLQLIPISRGGFHAT